MSLADKFNLLDGWNVLRIICGAFFLPHIYGKFFATDSIGFFTAAGFKPPRFWMYVAAASLKEGKVQPVLSDYALPGHEIHAVFPSRRLISARVTAPTARTVCSMRSGCEVRIVPSTSLSVVATVSRGTPSTAPDSATPRTASRPRRSPRHSCRRRS